MAKPSKPNPRVALPANDPTLDDASLFRAAIGKVGPVKGGRPAAPKRKAPAPKPRSRIADERAAPPDADIDSGEGHEYKRPGVQDAVLRKLRRGTYRVDAELDLHGLTRERAHAEFISFLADARSNGLRCIRIIHGKGHHSGTKGPVIKQSLRTWLRRDEVLAYSSAPIDQGGSGATLVLLRAER